MYFQVDEILGRGEPGVLLEKSPESGVVHSHVLRHVRHSQVCLNALLHECPCSVHNLPSILVRLHAIVAVRHKHKPQHVIHYSREQLLEEALLAFGRQNGLSVEFYYFFIVTYVIDRPAWRKETLTCPAVHIAAVEAYPIFAPAGFGVREVTVPLPGKQHEHISSLDIELAPVFCIKCAFSFCNIEQLVF